MPNPTKPGVRKNLRRGGQPGHKGRNQHTFRTGNPKDDKAAQKEAMRLLSHPKYRRTLQEKLNDCTLHPSVHVALLYYAYGKPTEHIETKEITPVSIVHEYSKAKD